MEEKQLNMPDEHPVPKKKRKGKGSRIFFFQAPMYLTKKIFIIITGYYK